MNQRLESNLVVEKETSKGDDGIGISLGFTPRVKEQRGKEN